MPYSLFTYSFGNMKLYIWKVDVYKSIINSWASILANSKEWDKKYFHVQWNKPQYSPKLYHTRIAIWSKAGKKHKS